MNKKMLLAHVSKSEQLFDLHCKQKTFKVLKFSVTYFIVLFSLWKERRAMMFCKYISAET